MYPFSSLQSIYHVAFLSELSLLFLFICSISSSSASTLQLKRFLIQTAYNLRNETPSDETPSNDINEEEKEENEWKKLFDRLKLYHVVLGNQLNHPVVLFDEDGDKCKEIGELEFVTHQHHVSSTTQYEKVMNIMNQLYPTNTNFPVCLACTTNYISYPFNHGYFILFR